MFTDASLRAGYLAAIRPVSGRDAAAGNSVPRACCQIRADKHRKGCARLGDDTELDVSCMKDGATIKAGTIWISQLYPVVKRLFVDCHPVPLDLEFRRGGRSAQLLA